MGRRPEEKGKPAVVKREGRRFGGRVKVDYSYPDDCFDPRRDLADYYDKPTTEMKMRVYDYSDFRS